MGAKKKGGKKGKGKKGKKEEEKQEETGTVPNTRRWTRTLTLSRLASYRYPSKTL